MGRTKVGGLTVGPESLCHHARGTGQRRSRGLSPAETTQEQSKDAKAYNFNVLNAHLS
jgi:hypothetical protein